MANPITMTIPEAVRLSGISRSGVYEALKGDLKAVKSGRKTLIYYADLEAYLANLPAYRGGAMSNGRYAKPGAGTPGFARSIWKLVASFNYPVELAGASNCALLWPVAIDGAGSLLAGIWGGLQ